MQISPQALDKLKGYHWAGNVRELQHTIEKSIILSEGDTLGVDDFTFHRGSDHTEHDSGTFNLAEHERTIIHRALKACNGNISEAAKLLGITRKTLYNKLAKYELQ